MKRIIIIISIISSLLFLYGCGKNNPPAPHDSINTDMFDISSNSSPDNALNILLEPDAGETDSDGIYTGELDRYVRDKTEHGMLYEEIEAAESEIEGICEELSSMIFTMDSGTLDYTDRILERCHEKFQKSDEVQNIYKLFSGIHMESKYIKTIPHTSMFFNDSSGNLYCKYIGSIIFRGSSDCFENGDYVNVVEFDMVHADGEWKLLDYLFHETCTYEEGNYSLHFAPDCKGTKLAAEPFHVVTVWTFDNVDAFMTRLNWQDELPEQEGEYDVYVIESESAPSD